MKEGKASISNIAHMTGDADSVSRQVKRTTREMTRRGKDSVNNARSTIASDFIGSQSLPVFKVNSILDTSLSEAKELAAFTQRLGN